MSHGHTVLRPHGIVIATDGEGRTIEADCLQCCHCQAVWQVQPGSGRKRGFCQKCGQVTCGAAGCLECVPFEKRLDLYEAGKRNTL
jgi:hypothetical protein